MLSHDKAQKEVIRDHILIRRVHHRGEHENQSDRLAKRENEREQSIHIRRLSNVRFRLHQHEQLQDLQRNQQRHLRLRIVPQQEDDDNVEYLEQVVHEREDQALKRVIARFQSDEIQLPEALFVISLLFVDFSCVFERAGKKSCVEKLKR